MTPGARIYYPDRGFGTVRAVRGDSLHVRFDDDWPTMVVNADAVLPTVHAPAPPARCALAALGGACGESPCDVGDEG